MANKKEVRKNRVAPRKEVYPVKVSHMAYLHDLAKISLGGEIVQASATGLLLHLDRTSLVPRHLRSNLNLDVLLGTEVFLRLEDMELEISGIVARTQFKGKQGFFIAIDYTADAPEYWRECLMDLLPTPAELGNRRE